MQCILKKLTFRWASMKKSTSIRKTTKTVRSLTFILVFALLIGCAQIPMEAIKLNQEVSRTIVILKENRLKLIDAWEMSGHVLIQNKWKTIYNKAVQIYDAKSDADRTILEKNAFRDENIGEIAAAIMEKIKAIISTGAKEMRQVVEKNTQDIVASNDSITRLLVSANAVGQTRTYLLDLFNNILPFNIPNINDILKKELPK